MNIKRNEDIVHQYPNGKMADQYAYSQSAEVFHTKQLFLFSEKVVPGRKASAPHFHESIDEVVYITRGEIWAIEGENEELLKLGDSACFYAKSDKLHYLENRSSEDAEFLIFRRAIKGADAIYE